MKKSVWIIQAETNIHVGNENTTGTGLIDKAVQRNVLTEIPCINASSLKGAMNEYATTPEAKLSSTDRVAIFGVDKGKTDKEVETQKGGCLFFDAHLLLLPIQDDKQLYKLVTSKETLEEYSKLLKLMGINYSYDDLKKELKTLDPHFDGEEGAQNSIRKFEEFKQLCSDDELPIIARNCLIGKGNLWYEQVLPQKSVFGTMLIVPTEVEVAVKENNPVDNKKKTYKYESIENIDQKINNAFHDKVIQIGANATIGYGYCTFKNIKEE